MYDMSMSQGLTRVASGKVALNALDDAACGGSGDQTPRPVPPVKLDTPGHEQVVELPLTSSQHDITALEGTRLSAGIDHKPLSRLCSATCDLNFPVSVCRTQLSPHCLCATNTSPEVC